MKGHPFLIGVEDILCQPISGQKKGIFGQTPSVYTQTYIKQTSKKVEKLLQNMNCRQGNVFLQMIQKNGIFYFLEMGYRLEGVGLWINWKKLYQFSTLELMVELALGRSLSAQAEKLKIISLQKSQKLGGIYMIWANPGRIARIEGREELEQIIPETKIFWEKFFQGDKIKETENMYQIAYGISIIANHKDEMKEKIEKINQILHIYDPKGNDLLIPFKHYF